MVLGPKITIVAVSSVLLTAGAGLMIERSVIHKQGTEMIVDSMRTTLLGAEYTRRSFSAMRGAGANHPKSTEAIAQELRQVVVG